MSLTGWVIGAGLIALATKAVGYLVPSAWLEYPHIGRLASAITVGLLASLIMLNTFANGQRLALDARAAALVVAVIACRLRAPFLVVVVLGALTAALVRLAGGV